MVVWSGRPIGAVTAEIMEVFPKQSEQTVATTPEPVVVASVKSTLSLVVARRG